MNTYALIILRVHIICPIHLFQCKIKCFFLLTNRDQFWVKEFRFCLQFIQPQFHGSNPPPNLIREGCRFRKYVARMLHQCGQLSQNIHQRGIVDRNEFAFILPLEFQFAIAHVDRSDNSMNQRHYESRFRYCSSISKIFSTTQKSNLLYLFKPPR